MVIWEENHSASAITPSAAPHISAYAADCGLATDYQSLTHPSLPNYLAATSGVSYASSPWNSDCQATSCTTAAENLFDQVGPSGWKGYAESMTSTCQRSNSGQYVSRHNPAVYYTDLGAACAADDVPLGSVTGGSLLSDIQAGTLPTVSTVTPNLIDDMHNGTVAQGDAWLSPVDPGDHRRSGLPVRSPDRGHRLGRGIRQRERVQHRGCHRDVPLRSCGDPLGNARSPTTAC